MAKITSIKMVKEENDYIFKYYVFTKKEVFIYQEFNVRLYDQFSRKSDTTYYTIDRKRFRTKAFLISRNVKCEPGDHNVPLNGYRKRAQTQVNADRFPLGTDETDQMLMEELL